MTADHNFRQTLISSCILIGLGTIASTANSALTIIEPSKTGSSQTRWQSQNSLSSAKSIMYTNNAGISQSSSVKRIDNGYISRASTTSTNSHYQYNNKANNANQYQNNTYQSNVYNPQTYNSKTYNSKRYYSAPKSVDRIGQLAQSKVNNNSDKIGQLVLRKKAQYPTVYSTKDNTLAAEQRYYSSTNSYNHTPNNVYSSTGNYGSNSYGGAYGYSDMLPISTGSKGVLVIDVETGKTLYSKNANTARPIASITKLMTAMVVLDAGQDMREEIKLDPIDFVGPKKSGSRLKSGDRMNREELLLMTLMKSENPAAKTLARHYPGGYNAFMRAMNRKAQQLGMYSAFFGDPTGLDKRNIASPVDLVKMVKAAGEYPLIRKFSTSKNHDFIVSNYSAGNRIYPAKNTSSLVRSGAYPIAISKTGFIREAGRCVVMETNVNNRPAVIVILGANSSSTRWNDAENILNNLALRRTV